MEKENEGRCPVGGVSPHGGEHVMVLLIPVGEVRRVCWNWELGGGDGGLRFEAGFRFEKGGDRKCTLPISLITNQR